jgi:O-antigen/teichoic acid export membrane protein
VIGGVQLGASSLKRNALFLFAEPVAAGIVLFFQYKILLNQLGLGDIGVWTLVVATTSLARLADVGIGGGLTRFVATAMADRSAETARRYIDTALITVAALYVVLSIAAYFPVWIILGTLLSGDQLILARSLLPITFASFIMLNINSTILSALVGAQRADLRSVIVVAGYLIQLVGTWFLIRYYGLFGVGVAQVAQYAFGAVAGAAAVSLVIPGFTWRQMSWDRPAFRTMAVFGLKLQIGTVALFFFEPVAKMMIARFGGVDLLAYFDMSYRLTMQVRSAIVSAAQSVVPVFAGLHARGRDEAVNLLSRTVRLGWPLTLYTMSTLAALSPLISLFWIGHMAREFLLFTSLNVVCWTFNLLAVPAYLYGTGTGQINHNIIGHVLTGILVPVAGFTVGPIFGPMAVVVAALLAKMLGDLLPVFARGPAQVYLNKGAFSALSVWGLCYWLLSCTALAAFALIYT